MSFLCAITTGYTLKVFGGVLYVIISLGVWNNFLFKRRSQVLFQHEFLKDSDVFRLKKLNSKKPLIFNNSGWSSNPKK